MREHEILSSRQPSFQGIQNSLAHLDNFNSILFKMLSLALLVGAGLTLVSAAPAPAPTLAAKLENRATTCTFTDAAAASKSKTSCSTIVLSNIAVPSGTTLDMTKLNSGTHVSSTETVEVIYLCRPRSSSRARLHSATKSGQVH